MGNKQKPKPKPTEKKPAPKKSSSLPYLGGGYSSARHNNPGNLRGSNYLKGCLGRMSAKSHGKDIGEFLVYDTIENGLAAYYNFLKSSVGTKIAIADGFEGPRKSLLAVIMRYATPDENNLNDYVSDMGSIIKMMSPNFEYYTLPQLFPQYPIFKKQWVGTWNVAGKGKDFYDQLRKVINTKMPNGEYLLNKGTPMNELYSEKEKTNFYAALFEYSKKQMSIECGPKSPGPMWLKNVATKTDFANMIKQSQTA